MIVLPMNCLDGMRGMADNSVDAVVTDPPYGISFMGKRWDYDVPVVAIWEEALRVLKPGGYMLAFASTRTQHRMTTRIEDAAFEIRDMIAWVYGSGMPKHQSSLKPAFEPITLARKPAPRATLLNIDACRVEGRERTDYGLSQSTRTFKNTFGQPSPSADFDSSLGRYPANLIHDGSDEVLAGFPDSNGSGGSVPNVKITGYGDGIGTGKSEYLGGERTPHDAGTGSAARFFYCAKASRAERGEANSHPTVKPIALMRYLCKLITPADGLILDPFAGSGSTGVAAKLEGFRFIGFELDAAHAEVANRRIAK